MNSAYPKNLVGLCFAAIMFCACGCALFESDDGAFYTRPTPAERIEVKERAGRTITFSVTCSWPDGCGRYSHFTARQQGNEYTVQIFGGRTAAAVCPAVVIHFIAPVEIKVPAPGAYDFHFWQSDTTSIDTSLVVG